ncbi:oxygen-independent coproporphyrinogen III oxidase [Oricola sp.]|uniref:oxygen-independent coproporphyrinogen III oxidase n=1 Tax=Oricola sp. TaxID=1979950 RepID=UPI003BA9C057
MNVEEIFASYRGAVPRYTSYPTAPHFADLNGAGIEKQALLDIETGEPVSLYVHVPFCDRLCWFCGCHTKHTLKYAPVAAYIGSLITEMQTVAKTAGRKLPLAHLHFGGGSPSMLCEEDFHRLSEALRENFDISDQTEISVEFDPSDVTEATLRGAAVLGVTRASVGVQDFDSAVQKAINRPQTFEQTRDVIAALRGAGVGSVNIDALYGLPLQTRDRLEATIDQVLTLRPDRIALFGYAHVPWVKKHQTMIREADLPGTLDRFHHAAYAADMIANRGYDRIGIDHFALPDDDLAVAAHSGRLYRNFQGYTTDACRTLIGLGASAISFFGTSYVQNIVATKQYENAVQSGNLAGMRGVRLNMDDRVRAHIIERLMCDFALSFADLEDKFGYLARPYEAEARALAAADPHKLVETNEIGITIKPEARAFTRIVASWFDAYLDTGEVRYSKAV